MSALTQWLFLGGWLTIGFLVGRWNRRVGTGILWIAVMGPLGVLFVAYGESRRRRASSAQPTLAPGAENLNLPIEVALDGEWHEGLLQGWSLATGAWQGWVVQRHGPAEGSELMLKRP